MKTNVGTNPEGSEWMMVTLDQKNGMKGTEWAIKDLVEESKTWSKSKVYTKTIILFGIFIGP